MGPLNESTRQTCRVDVQLDTTYLLSLTLPLCGRGRLSSAGVKQGERLDFGRLRGGKCWRRLAGNQADESLGSSRPNRKDSPASASEFGGCPFLVMVGIDKTIGFPCDCEKGRKTMVAYRCTLTRGTRFAFVLLSPMTRSRGIVVSASHHHLIIAWALDSDLGDAWASASASLKASLRGCLENSWASAFVAVKDPSEGKSVAGFFEVHCVGLVIKFIRVWGGERLYSSLNSVPPVFGLGLVVRGLRAVAPSSVMGLRVAPVVIGLTSADFAAGSAGVGLVAFAVTDCKPLAGG